MFDFQRVLYALPGILIGLTLHEFCHALCAYKLGDDTAKEQGRLTLNPLKHIDIIGLLFIIIAGFGWAKPVQFNPEKLKNYRRDKALIAASGPVSNLLLGIIFALVSRFIIFYTNVLFTDGFLVDIAVIIYATAQINFGLFIFNLLPIPPLDGSHIVFSGLNIAPDTELKIRKIGMPLLLLIIILQNYANITIIPIGFLINKLMGLFAGF